MHTSLSRRRFLGSTEGALTDQYLKNYGNMYGDLSAGSGLNSLIRDWNILKGSLNAIRISCFTEVTVPTQLVAVTDVKAAGLSRQYAALPHPRKLSVNSSLRTPENSSSSKKSFTSFRFQYIIYSTIGALAHIPRKIMIIIGVLNDEPLFVAQ